MAKFGKLLNEKAAELIAAISGDLAPNLVLADPKVQQQIIVALNGAENDLEEGMSGLPIWKLIETVATALPNEPRAAARAAVAAAKSALDIAILYFQKEQADSKFRLKLRRSLAQ